MRKPIEKAAKVLLRHSKAKRFVPTRDQSIQSNSRALPLEPAQVQCPFKSQQFNPTAFQKSQITEATSILPPNATWSLENSLPFSSVPTPEGLPIDESLSELFKAGIGTHLHEYSRIRHSQLGPIFKEDLGAGACVYVSDPLLYGEITRQEGDFPDSFKPESFKLYNENESNIRNDSIFFSSGEEWWRLRKPVNQVLLKRSTQQLLPLVMSSYEDFLTEIMNEWNMHAAKDPDSILDMDNHLVAIGFSGLARIAMGSQFDEMLGKLDYDLNTIYDAIHEMSNENTKLVGMSVRNAKESGMDVWKNFEKSMGILVDASKSLSKLCAENILRNANNPNFGPREGGLMYYCAKDLSIRDLSEIFCGFLATPDPVTASLKWALAVLARHPDVQDDIYQEIQQVCGPNNKVTVTHLEQLKTVKMTLKETMRMYPAAPFLVRQMPQDSVIGGYRIPAGQTIALCIYASHRNAKYFPDPLRYWPGRWARNDENQLVGVNDPAAFRPFGLGKRGCVGKIIGDNLCQMLIARTVQQFHMSSEEVHPVMKTLMIPDRPVDLRLKIR